MKQLLKVFVPWSNATAQITSSLKTTPRRGHVAHRVSGGSTAWLLILQKASSEVSRISRDAIRACFASVGARKKYDIAQAIARQIPALAHRPPRVRKIWMSEDPRQSLFDAAALGLAFYAINKF